MNNTRALKLTYGAMLAAIFGMLMLLNRQTGGFLQGVLVFILPIPMAIYAVRYGLRAGITVFIVMVASSFLFGDFTSVFYGISSAFLGLVLGTRLNRHRDPMKTLILIMVLGMVLELFDMLVIAYIATGETLDTDVREMQQAMEQAFRMSEQITGQSMEQQQSIISILTPDVLRRVMIVSIAAAGALDGFVVYTVSILIMRRLHIPVQKPAPVAQYYPPKWTGILGIGLFLLYNVTFSKPFENELLQNIAQMAGLAGYFYLMCFGVIAMIGVLQKYITKNHVLIVILALLSLMVLPSVDLILGFLYISGSLHERLMERPSGSRDRFPKF